MKKVILTIGAAALAGSLMFIQPMQSLAVSALSLFRVENTKTIQITMADMEELAGMLKDRHKQDFDMKKVSDAFASKDHQKPEVLTLDSIDEFTAFHVSLPKELKDQQPVLRMIDSQTKSFTVDTARFNEIAAKAGIQGKLGASYDNETIAVATSPVLWAEYENLKLMATQGPYLESPEGLGQEVWDILLELPGIPENLRSQLAEIDINARDIYLPVVMGVGREVDLGGTIGYIYASTDIKALAETLTREYNSLEYNSLEYNSPEYNSPEYNSPEYNSPEYNSPELYPGMDIIMGGEDIAETCNTMIWVKNNVLYVLTGSVSEDGLAKIARSAK